jgi:hypothetical protein
MEFLPQSDIQLQLDEIALALLKGQSKVVAIERSCDGSILETTYTIMCAGAEINITKLGRG